MELILQRLIENTFDFKDCSDVPSKGRCTTTYLCDIPNKARVAIETCTRGSFKFDFIQKKPNRFFMDNSLYQSHAINLIFLPFLTVFVYF